MGKKGNKDSAAVPPATAGAANGKGKGPATAGQEPEFDTYKSTSASKWGSIIIFVGLVSAVGYSHTKSRVDPYIAKLGKLVNVWDSQHSLVVQAINCGGRSVIGSNGVLYDADLDGMELSEPAGHAADLSSAQIKGDKGKKEEDKHVFQTERWCESDFTYQMKRPKRDGKYTLVMKWSENVAHHRAGSRVMSAKMNQKHTVVADIDLAKEAGLFTPHDVFFQFEIKGDTLISGTVESELGATIPVTLIKGRAENPKINGLAIISGKKDAAEAVFKPDGSASSSSKKKKNKKNAFNMDELDGLVAVMTVLALLHAFQQGEVFLVLILLVLSLVTEQASIRLGGTHCHNDGLVMVSVCSSLNSVVYYVPWMYSCIVSGRRLAGYSGEGIGSLSSDANKWLAPFLVGWLHFGFCGPYEMQGPNMKWWRYSNSKGFIKTIGNFSDFWVLHPNETGIATSPHAAAALDTRYEGMPVYATLFHFAIGFGFAMAMTLTNDTKLLAFLLTTPLALAWTLPVDLLEKLDIDKMTGVPLILLAAGIVPPLAAALFGRAVPKADEDKRTQKSEEDKPKANTPKSDFLLFSIPLINAVYFITIYWRFPGKVKSTQFLIVAVVNTISVCAHAFASGVVSTKPASTANTNSFFLSAFGNTKLSPKGSPVGYVIMAAFQVVCMYITLKKVAIIFPAFDFVNDVGAVALGLSVLCWGYSYRWQTDKLIDSHGLPLVVLLIATVAYKEHLNLKNPRGLIICFFTLLWSYRTYWKWDARVNLLGYSVTFDGMQSNWAGFLFCWITQGSWAVLVALPAMMLICSSPNAEFTDRDKAAMLGSLVSLLLSFIADEEELHFMDKHYSYLIHQTNKQKDGNEETGTPEPKWAEERLLMMRFSRYPNYVCEMLFWASYCYLLQGGLKQSAFGVAVLCLAVAGFYGFCATVMTYESETERDWAQSDLYQKYKKDYPLLLNSVGMSVGVVLVAAIFSGY